MVMIELFKYLYVCVVVHLLWYCQTAIVLVKKKKKKHCCSAQFVQSYKHRIKCNSFFRNVQVLLVSFFAKLYI